MKCELTSEGDESVLSLKGDLNIINAAQLKDELVQALDTAQCIVIDVSEVTDVDLSALQLFCAAHKSAVAKGKQLLLSSNLPDSLALQIQRVGIRDGHHCGRDSSLDCLWKGDGR